MNTHQIDLQNIKDEMGKITVAEHLPFEIKRVFMICFDRGQERGHHSMHKCKQLFIVTFGEVLVTINDENGFKKYMLKENGRGLLVPAQAWRVLKPLSNHAHMLVLASENYDDADSVRDYQEFQDVVQQDRPAIHSV